MARTREGLQTALQSIRSLRDEFWHDVNVTGEKNNLNPSLDYAGRVADYMEFAELLARDALHREESCGGHFREEYQTADNEARRNDDQFSYVGAWEFKGIGVEPVLHKEELTFDEVHPSQRSYK
jgi:succinate dehydrogenase / fumarate reductase flavoprotein subunit